MQIRIYDYNLTPITTLLPIDVNDVVYENQLNGDGYCEFSVRVDSQKISANAIEMYNKIKIFEGSKCVFYGVILDNNYNLNIITVRAVSLSNILKKRLISTNSAVGNINTVITTMINTMNAYNDTGISVGTINLLGTINKTYNNDTVDYVLNDLIGNSQSYIDTDGKLHVADVYGQDKSQSIVFKYDIRQIQNSNLNNFVVKESGQPIFSEIVGDDKFNNTVVAQNPQFVASYGILQGRKVYNNVNGNPYLLQEAQKDLSDRSFSPELSLSPKVEDNFDVGDIVTVRLYNKFININTQYQILVKTVNYIGSQKTIQVRVNDKQKTILDLLHTQQVRISQLENN